MSVQEDFTDLSKIKDRIAKLLRMADDASSPNEAAIAASRARKLMDKYQLSQLDIADSVEEDFATDPATRFYAAMPYHLNVFSVAVAKYNDVQAKLENGHVDHRGSAAKGHTKKWGPRIVFNGYKNDVQLAVQMFNSLSDVVDRLCREYVAKEGYTRFPVGIAKAFKVAAVLEISARLQAMTVERDKLTSETTGTSLVLMKSIAVAAHFGDAGYKGKKTKFHQDDESFAARQAGVQAGRSVEITKSVESE